MEVGAEAADGWTLPNRSLTGWAGPAFDEVGELTEKAFQSPNSPFPLDEAAAVGEAVAVVASKVTVSTWLAKCCGRVRVCLPVEVGRLAEAAGEEKSAKPPMRSELPPVEVDQGLA